MKTYAAGATLTELKAKFGIKGKGQLASAVLDALIRSSKMPQLARGRAKKELPSEFKVAVNLRGTIVLPKEAVSDAFHFSQGQAFIARRRVKRSSSPSLSSVLLSHCRGASSPSQSSAIPRI
ncbi:MAG: hypothetical protein Q8M03_14320 [Legionella sp.]|nr:hypothetical protein [Legionella sp.]